MKDEHAALMNEAELLELGRLVESDPTFSGFERQGRPVTNVEMFASIQFRRDQRRKADEILRDL